MTIRSVAIEPHPHSGCYCCGADNPLGLKLRFVSTAEGEVQATFACAEHFAGYPGMLHGGMICSLLDAAMTNCLLARGIRGVTVELSVRFRHPVDTGHPVTVRAWLLRDHASLHVLKGDVTQNRQVKAVGMGKFFEIPGDAHA